MPVNRFFQFDHQGIPVDAFQEAEAQGVVYFVGAFDDLGGDFFVFQLFCAGFKVLIFLARIRLRSSNYAGTSFTDYTDLNDEAVLIREFESILRFHTACGGGEDFRFL